MTIIGVTWGAPLEIASLSKFILFLRTSYIQYQWQKLGATADLQRICKQNRATADLQRISKLHRVRPPEKTNPTYTDVDHFRLDQKIPAFASTVNPTNTN